MVALARKIMVIIWHLLTNHESYDDELYAKSRQPLHVNVTVHSIISMVEVIQLLKDASVIIKKT